MKNKPIKIKESFFVIVISVMVIFLCINQREAQADDWEKGRKKCIKIAAHRWEKQEKEINAISKWKKGTIPTVSAVESKFKKYDQALEPDDIDDVAKKAPADAKKDIMEASKKMEKQQDKCIIQAEKQLHNVAIDFEKYNELYAKELKKEKIDAETLKKKYAGKKVIPPDDLKEIGEKISKCQTKAEVAFKKDMKAD